MNFDLLESLLPVFGAGVVLVAVGWGVRFLRLCWVGRSPRVQVAPFSWAAEGGEPEALWVTSLFRDHLKKLQLDGLDAVPDRAPGAPLVQIVEGVGQAVGPGGGWGKVMGRLWRVVWPDAAYEAWATLHPSEKGSGSISIQLIRRRGGNRTLVSFTSEPADWDTCTREAAMAAAGALYPHLSKGHKGPWVDWKKPVPPDLLGLYQSALEHERNHQFEQALAEFRAIVEKDPLNPQLRLKVAMVEERLDLHLGAWFTYWAIVAESDRRLWRGPHRRTRLVALYRLAIHLWNPALAKEWVRTQNYERDGFEREELKLLRAELVSVLRRELVFNGSGEGKARDGAATASASELMGLTVEKAAARPKQIQWFEKGANSAIRTRQIAELLRIVSLDRLEELKARMSRRTRDGKRWPNRECRRRPLRRWLSRSELPPLAVEASEVLLRGLLAESAETRLRSKEGSPEDFKRAHGELLEHWPFPGWTKRRWYSKVVMRGRIWLENRRADAWQLHYNAACAIATQLPVSSVLRRRSGISKDEWAEVAIKELESFSYHAESPKVAGMADWIAFEDPDLEDLHPLPEFRLWSSQRFGFGLPKGRPLKGLVDRHTVLILKRSAAAFAASWRGRAESDLADHPGLLGWWAEEREIWKRLEKICREHQSWRCRLECFEALEKWNSANQPPIDFSREKREHRLAAKPLSSACLRGLWEQIGSEKDDNVKILGWVVGHVERATIASRRQRGTLRQDGSSPLHRREREAAIEAARIWSDIERRLETALRGSGAPDWTKLKPIT